MTLSKSIQWVFIFLAMVFLQTTIVHHISVAGVAPDMVLIALFILAIVYGRLSGIWAGFLVGLLLDVYSSGTFGTRALAYTTAGAFLGFFEQRRLAVNPSTQLILLIIASLITDSMMQLGTFGISNLSSIEFVKLLFVAFLPRAMYTSIIAAFVLGFKYYILPAHQR